MGFVVERRWAGKEWFFPPLLLADRWLTVLSVSHAVWTGAPSWDSSSNTQCTHAQNCVSCSSYTFCCWRQISLPPGSLFLVCWPLLPPACCLCRGVPGCSCLSMTVVRCCESQPQRNLDSGCCFRYLLSNHVLLSIRQKWHGHIVL